MEKKLRTIKDLDLQNKIVIVRSNLDVPIKNGVIQDDTRIKASIPTIQHLLSQNCKVVILGHLGRPEGKYDDNLSLMPVRFELGRILNKQIKFANIDRCENSIKFMEYGDVLLIENIRFSPEEESSNAKTRLAFIENLAGLADIYINDCFGLYRKHASVYEIAQIMPSFAGLSLENEIEVLTKLKESVEKPYVGIIGGAKLDTKINIIDKLVEKLDKLLLGGALAYTFMKAEGSKVGKSSTEDELIKKVEKILLKAKKNKCEILLPIDHVCASELSENAEPIYVDKKDMPKDLFGLDIGAKTIELYKNALTDAKTILWNGPMGVFEWKNFSKGTQEIGEYMSIDAPRESFKIVGGGDTISAINMFKIRQKRFNHVSLGGGMMLEFLSGEEFEILDILFGKQKI
jgi:3-phosphoglycerate kinase